MTLKYDYQYDIAAIVIMVLLLFTIYVRKAYKTKSTIIFVALLVSNLFSALLDAISCYTITYPFNVPLHVNYIVSLGYLFLYNECTVLFFLYIYSKAQISKFRKLVNRTCITATLFFAGIIFSSPITHWVAYFDQFGEYQHGAMFEVLYFISFAVFLLEVMVFVVAREKFNLYQVYASLAMILSMGISLVISIEFPRLLVGQMCMAIILVFVYIAFENPAHYTYKETTCRNRRAFIDTVRRRKMENKSFGIIAFSLLDYDYLRHNHGIDVMEKATSMIAEFLRFHFRSNAYALADDKYAILVCDDVEAVIVKQQVRDFFAKPLRVNGILFHINISVIEIEKLDLTFDVDEIENLVDYGVTYSDKDRITMKEVYKIVQEKQRREQILHAIKKALENDGFEVYYQPIYDTSSGEFHSAEALIRLIDPDVGLINPEELISLAEESGYISQIGELVFRKVCAFLSNSRARELGISYIEVNLSPKQCLEPTLAACFQKIMQECDISPWWINLEITETAQISGNRYWLENVERLHRCGVEFSIDDYGSGFASAEYLIKLPISIVKIDKMILWSAMKEESAMIVLRHTIRMLKELGKKIVVEGVEDEEMIKVLNENGVDYQQGFYYCKPIPEQEFIDFLEKHNKDIEEKISE